MSFHKHLDEANAFDDLAVAAMAQAFNEACIALGVFAGDARGRDIIATRVIDLARTGVLDPAALRDRVLLEARSAA